MGQLVVYGFWEDTRTEFPSKLALLNLEIFNSTQGVERPVVSFDISAFLPSHGHGAPTIRVRRLQAPGADIIHGNQTTWAGQTFSVETEGLAHGNLVEQLVVGSVVDVEASGAALVFLS